MNSNAFRDCRVLAIEDEYYLAMDLERDLTDEGAIVLGPVPSVAQAMHLIENEPTINAAILDLNLGGEMAYPVADALSARKIPFLFTTGYSDGEIQSRYPGVVSFEKPVEFASLKAALIRLLHS